MKVEDIQKMKRFNQSDYILVGKDIKEQLKISKDELKRLRVTFEIIE